MTPLESPLLTTNQIKSLPQIPPSEKQVEARKNLFARPLSADAATGDLAYGCVDWFLYSGEPLGSVGY